MSQQRQQQELEQERMERELELLRRVDEKLPDVAAELAACLGLSKQFHQDKERMAA